jgi:hypothetical protein
VSYQKTEKNTNADYHCAISVFILTTSKLEAIQENHRCSLKLVKSGLSVWEGEALLCTSFHLSGEQVQRVALGYAFRVATFHCPISVSFSFSTFLCFAASWTGVDKKYSHCLGRTAVFPVLQCVKWMIAPFWTSVPFQKAGAISEYNRTPCAN